MPAWARRAAGLERVPLVRYSSVPAAPCRGTDFQTHVRTMASTPPAPADTHADWTFEAALDRLGEIVGRIEGESLELDESLALFEEGVRLLRFAEGVLEGADQRIRQLLDDGLGGSTLQDFAEEP